MPNDVVWGSNFGWAAAIGPKKQLLVGSAYDSDPVWASGSAYLYDLATMDLTRKFTADDAKENDAFGCAVAIDADRVAIGAERVSDLSVGGGAVYLLDATTGRQIAKLLPADVERTFFFGQSVALGGGRLLVGSWSSRAYLYDSWTGAPLGVLRSPSNTRRSGFGFSVAIEGDLALIGAPWDKGNGSMCGSAYLVDLRTRQIIRELVPTDGVYDDHFGKSVAISGGLALVGAPRFLGSFGSAYVFDLTTGEQLQKITPDEVDPEDWFGERVSLWGGTALIAARGDDDGAEDCGAAYVYDARSGSQVAKLVPSDPTEDKLFGFSVAARSNLLVVGAVGDSRRPDEWRGAAYVYDGAVGGCDADFSGDGITSMHDVFLYLSYWAMGDARTDFDGNGSIDTADVLAFLRAWAEGC